MFRSRLLYIELVTIGVGGMVDIVVAPWSSFWVWTAVLIVGIAGLILTTRKPQTSRPGTPSAAAQHTPAPTMPAISANGKETARLILRADNLVQAHALYTAFVSEVPADERFMGHIVNKAYMHRLDEAGETEDADKFYREKASKDEDSIRHNIEFAELVQKVREK